MGSIRSTWLGAIATLVLGAPAPGAHAVDRELVLLSGGSANQDAAFAGAVADGSGVVFTTAEALLR